MDELLPHFIAEARDLIQQASDDLLALERSPGDTDRLDSAFRAVHTLKGSVGLFDLEPLGVALHAAEDVLAAVRTDRLILDATAVDSLLGCLEAAERWVNALAETGGLPPEAAETGKGLMKELRSLLDGAGTEGTSEPVAGPGATAGGAWADSLFAAGAAAGAIADPSDEPVTAIRYEPRPDCFFSGDDPVGLISSVPGLLMLRISEREAWPAAASIDPYACNLVIEALALAPHAIVAPIFRFVPDQVAVIARVQAARPRRGAAPGSATPSSAREGPRTMRVDAGRVDRLATLVGELIVAKNALAHVAETALTTDPALVAEQLQESRASIERLTGSLHAAIASVRMLPLRDVFRRFPRPVREMATRLGKSITLTVEGEDIEADKSVIETLFEPLIHVLRNAVDHGAEAPAVRRAAGKPPEATIALRAVRAGNELSITVTDDGQGIDPARIRDIARDRALLAPEALAPEALAPEALAAMPDSAVIDLIFTPGFSTAGAVTDLSGRGVGMDAVRVAVEALGGTVGVSSRLGEGTTVRMVLPTSVVMTTILTVGIGERTYGVPMDAVIETLRIRPGDIVPIKGGEAFVFRDRTIPLVRLASLLGPSAAAGTTGTAGATGSTGATGATGATGTAGLKVLIVPVDEEPVGVGVDEVIDRMHVMMRPMAGLLAGAPGLIGTTIVGDGSVLIVLDIAELIR